MRASRYRRGFTLSGELDTAKIDAQLKDGVLRLRIPKLAEAHPGVLNLETAVGRARVGRHGVGWQGGTTLLATASKEEQRGQRAPGRFNRVRSAFTQTVNVFVVKKVSVHGNFQRKISGQLLFLG